MNDLEAKKAKVSDLLRAIVSPGPLDLKFQILSSDANGGSQDVAGTVASQIRVAFTGPDVPLLLDRNGELLLALEHVAAKVLRYEQDEHDQISFDAEQFKQQRHEELELAAKTAIERVRRTGEPFAFAPMNSRERRLLHLALGPSGLPTASSGEGPRRFVVLYPEGDAPPPPPSANDRAQAIRQRFRRR